MSTLTDLAGNGRITVTIGVLGGKKMTQREISNAEWEVMRLLWSLGEASSKQLADLLVKKQGWKAATVKTLLGGW